MSTQLPPPPPLRPITPVERSSARWLGAFFLAFLVLGLLSNGYALIKGKFDVLSRPVAWGDFVHGKLMADLATDLANAPLPDEIARAERGVSWLAVGDLGPRVRQGERDWLFLVDELSPHPDGAASAQARARDVIAMKDHLRKVGIQLLVVVVPDKTRIVSNHLGAIHRPPLFTPRIDDFMRTIEANGIQALNLTDVLASMNTAAGGMPFLRTDTHWTEEGAQASAEAVANRVRAMGIKPVPSVNRQVASQKVLPRSGDLIRLAGIDWLPPTLTPTPDQARTSTFADGAAAPAAASADNNNDLFGDADLPNIALVGSSFSRTSAFVPFLDVALQTRVASFARDGGGFSASLQTYLKSSSFRETPPKLIIWEIPERVLQAPATSDRVSVPAP